MVRSFVESSDSDTLQLLNQGAAAAANAAANTKAAAAKVNEMYTAIHRLQEQVNMLTYSLNKVFQTLNTYPAVKEQLDQLDYRTLGISRAVVNHVFKGFLTFVESEAEAVRIELFNDLSAKDDIKMELQVVDNDEITMDHVVTFTSTCAVDPDQGVFRSKIAMNMPDFAEYAPPFLGKKVGETLELKLKGFDHVITILTLRKKIDGTQS